MLSGSWAWLLIAILVVVLGVAILYGARITRQRRKDRLAETRRDEATRELYDKRPPPQVPPD